MTSRPVRVVASAVVVSVAACASRVSTRTTASRPSAATQGTPASRSGAAPDPHTAAPAPSSDAPSGSQRDVTAPHRPCDPEDGPLPDCASLPQDACLGATLTRRACDTVAPWLAPSAANRWLACLHEKTDAVSVCDSGRIVACGLRAAEGACVDGSFHELCQSLAEACADVAPDITVARCEQLLAAFRPEHRPKLVDCLQQGCGSGAFGVCLP